jgi:hypothetical protein
LLEEPTFLRIDKFGGRPLFTEAALFQAWIGC